ncbi:Angio-associated migratory cell, partial [Paramicrosporidium saccamoebae]
MSLLELDASVTDFGQLEKLHGIGSNIRNRLEKRFVDDGGSVPRPPQTIPLVVEPAPKRRRAAVVKEYVPAFRSGPYAMLIALHLEKHHPNPKGYLLKQEIVSQGQAYCLSPMDEGPFCPIQGAIKTLIAKGFVEKCSIPARFSLTDTGVELAERLWNSGERRSSAPMPESPPSVADEEVEMNPLGSPDFETFTISQFDIVLLVDTREVKSREDRDFIINRLQSAGIPSEQRCLELGDFMWIARAKPHVHYIVERKREDDLLASIPDGRFIEQKNLIYLVEKSGSADFSNIGKDKFDAAIVHTQIVDGLHLRYTSGIEETLRFLITLSIDITNRAAESLHAGIMGAPVIRDAYFSKLEAEGKLTGRRLFQSFGCFTQMNSKSANLSIKDLFMKQLLSIRQLTVEKAAAITQKFPSALSLWRHYQSLATEKSREHYFKEWEVSESQRKFGLKFRDISFIMRDPVPLEEFLAGKYSVPEDTAPDICAGGWVRLQDAIANAAPSELQNLGEDFDFQPFSTQTQNQIMSLWKSEYETPCIERTSKLILSPATPTLFDDCDCPDDDMLAIPSQPIGFSQEFKTAGGKTIPPPSPANRRTTADLPVEMPVSFVGFATAAGRKIDRPSAEAISRAESLLRDSNTPRITTKFKSPSKELKLAIDFPLQSTGLPLQPTNLSHPPTDLSLQPTDLSLQPTDLSFQSPQNMPKVSFQTAAGRRIKSPSKDALKKADQIFSSGDNFSDGRAIGPLSIENSIGSDFNSTSMFSSASGRKIATPSSAAIAKASKILSSVNSDHDAATGPPGSITKGWKAPLDVKAPKKTKLANPQFKSPSLINPFETALVKGVERSGFMAKLNSTKTPPRECSTLTFDICKGSVSVINQQQNATGPVFSNVYASALQCFGSLDVRWIQNHMFMIIWKLLSYYNTGIADFCGMSLNTETVISQLCYRYDREINKAQRSILKKIAERDDSPSAYMVLFVSSLQPDCAMSLSDGWYSLKVTHDLSIERLITSEKIKVGQKLKVSLAQVVSEEATDILDAQDKVRLKIFGNSTRPARWHAKLGRHRSVSFIVSLSSVDADGGLISCLQVAVIRRYPALYMVERESGQRQTVTEEELDNLTRSEDYTESKSVDQIISVRMTVKFKVADCCGKPGALNIGIVTLWDSNPEMYSRVVEGSILQITSMKPTIKKRNVVYISSVRTTRIFFLKDYQTEKIPTGRPPINPNELLEEQEDYDLLGVVVRWESDHLWLAIGRKKVASVKLLRNRSTMQVLLLDISFMYYDPRHGFPVFLSSEQSQIVKDPTPFPIQEQVDAAVIAAAEEYTDMTSEYKDAADEHPKKAVDVEEGGSFDEEEALFDEEEALVDEEEALLNSDDILEEYDGEDPMIVDATMDDDVVPYAAELELHDGDPSYSLSVNPHDPTLIASGGGNDKAVLFRLDDTDTLKVDILTELCGHTDTVEHVKFSTDGKLLATGSLDGTVRIWTTEGSCVHWLDWHPKGPVLAAGSADGTVWMWNAQLGKCMNVFTGNATTSTCGAFSPSGKQLVTGGDGVVFVWDPKDGTASITYTGNQLPGDALSLSVHPVMPVALVGFSDGMVAALHLGHQQILSQHSTGEAAVECVSFMKGHSIMMAGSLGGTVHMFDANNYKVRGVLGDGEMDGVTSYTWLSNEGCLAVGCLNGTIMVWDGRKGELLASLPIGMEENAIFDLVEVPNLLLASFDDGKVRIVR